MKIIWQLVIVFVVTLGLSGCFRHEKEITGSVFTDSTGVQWRILAQNEKGNQLVITEYVHGIVQYNSSNVYTFLGQSDGLRIALNTWFVDTLAPELRENALPAENVDNDVRLTIGDDADRLIYHEVTVHENEPAGWTAAGTGTASPENSLFVLSVSEVNKYSKLGTLNMQGKKFSPSGNLVPASWWLRSPGSSSLSPVAVMSAGGTFPHVSAVPATEKYGFRPALWISRPGG